MKFFRTEFRAMGCDNEIVVASTSESQAQAAMQAAAEEVQRIEGKFSRYRSDSIIGRINGAAGTPQRITCDTEMLELLNVADELYRLSGGLFDVTSGVLRRAWNFSSGEVPSQDKIDALLPLIGWDKVERSGNTVRLAKQDMEIDFGGFGKEYASDRAAKELESWSIAHGYVNLAGDIRAVGPQPDGTAWPIGVQNPRNGGEIVSRISLSKGALATSGDYEKFFEADGKRYCHVLNPKTGYPVTHWASVTVAAPSALRAGAWTTIAMLKEAEALDALAASGCPYFLVDAQGRTFFNKQ